MPNPPRKIRPSRAKASKPTLPSLDEHLKKLLNPGLIEKAKSGDQTGSARRRQSAFEVGPVTADGILAEAFDLPRPEGGAEMGGRAVSAAVPGRRPQNPIPTASTGSAARPAPSRR